MSRTEGKRATIWAQSFFGNPVVAGLSSSDRGLLLAMIVVMNSVDSAEITADVIESTATQMRVRPVRVRSMLARCDFIFDRGPDGTPFSSKTARRLQDRRYRNEEGDANSDADLASKSCQDSTRFRHPSEPHFDTNSNAKAVQVSDENPNETEESDSGSRPKKGSGSRDPSLSLSGSSSGGRDDSLIISLLGGTRFDELRDGGRLKDLIEGHGEGKVVDAIRSLGAKLAEKTSPVAYLKACLENPSRNGSSPPPDMNIGRNPAAAADDPETVRADYAAVAPLAEKFKAENPMAEASHSIEAGKLWRDAFHGAVGLSYGAFEQLRAAAELEASA